ncbi:FkbM family methyltransferase [Chloroflexota bacterium]
MEAMVRKSSNGVRGKLKRLLFLVFFPAIYLRRIYLHRFGKSYDKFYNSLFNMVQSGSAVVAIPDFQGLFEIDFRSHILKCALMNKQFEPELVELVRTYVDAEKDALDIGANIGLYAVLFSKIIHKSNRVLAIEPAPLALEYLRRNIHRNGCTQSVIIFEGIATDATGIFRMNVIPGMEEYSSVGEIVHPSVHNKSSEIIEVRGDTIDNLVNAFNLRPGFIKIDVEGAEYLVLNGAIETIQRYHPVILSELSDKMLLSCGANSEMVMRLVQNNDYRIMPLGGGFLAIPNAGNKTGWQDG